MPSSVRLVADGAKRSWTQSAQRSKNEPTVLGADPTKRVRLPSAPSDVSMRQILPRPSSAARLGDESRPVTEW